MALGPLPTELVYDPEFDRLVEQLGRLPQMFVDPVNFAAACAWIDGFSWGRHRTALLGFREWLVVRAEDGNNFHWSRLVLRELTGSWDGSGGTVDDFELIAGLTRLLQAYLSYREANGLSKVFWEYAEWIRRQDWYSGPLPSYTP